MHTHHHLILLATTFFASALASSFSTHSDYGQPWYDDNHYRVWRRRSIPYCSHEAVSPGEACVEDGKLKPKEPPAIAYPTLGPQPYRGERIPKDTRFFHFLSKTGESLGYWSMWTSAGGDVAVGKESGEDGKGQVEDVSDGVEKVEMDAREELKRKGLEEEKKEARGTVYHHFNTYVRPHVHKPVGPGPDAPVEKAIDEKVKRMGEDALKMVDYKEMKQIYESSVREREAKEEAEAEKKEKERVEKKDVSPPLLDIWPSSKEEQELFKKFLSDYLAEAAKRHQKAFEEVEAYLKAWEKLGSQKEAWKTAEKLLSPNR